MASDTATAPAQDLQAQKEQLLASAEDATAKAKEATAEAKSRVQRYADQIKDSASKTADSAKDYVSKVVNKVQQYAETAQASVSSSTSTSSSSSTSTSTGLRDTLSKAIAIPSNSGVESATVASDEESVKFPLSVVTWCTSICGSKVEATSSASTGSLQDQLSRGLDDAKATVEATQAAAVEKVQAAAETVKQGA